MTKSVFDAPQFKSQEGAFAYVEAQLWPNGAVCPHCGNRDQDRIRKMQGRTTRLGLYKCNECRKPFTVRMGTIFESSHLPLHLWLQVIHLMCASKEGISTRQIQRMLLCSMKTAWFLTHRIREAMRSDDFSPFGGGGGASEVGEVFIGQKDGKTKRRTFHRKMKVLELADHDSGQVHTTTDEHTGYHDSGECYADHGNTNRRRGAYVNLEERTIHSNYMDRAAQCPI